MNRFFFTTILLLAILSAFGERVTISAELQGDRIIQLPNKNIVESSDSIFCEGDLLESETYSIDYFRGTIYFMENAPCESVVIIYRTVNIELPLSIQNRIPVGSGGFLEPQAPRRNIGMFPQGSKLVHSGSLLRGIKIGTRRDLSMESQFQLEAFGGIGENVEITAILSDQNLPIQPEGTSEKIAQLDQVFIGVKAPHFGASFGDFQADFARNSEFAKYSRRFSGVRLEGFSNILNAEAVGAVLEGVWATDNFNGIEGNQGPYQIKAGNRSSIQILAGTETVWLDGARLQRGSDNDYIIDYNLGQITFTNKTPIKNTSRIVVDFQFTDLEYSRSFYGAGSSIKPIESFTIGATAMFEMDDPNSPLSFEMGETERRALISAGDNPDSAYIWSAFLSDSGDYILADSATNSAHFVYMGERLGNWKVSFSEVGAGNGDYIKITTNEFRYIGRGLGNYQPIKKLPLPGYQSLMDFRTVFEPFDSVILSGEFASSIYDKNRLSEMNDADNSDRAYNLSLRSGNELVLWGDSFGKITSDSRYRFKGRNFSLLGRLDDAEFSRDWDLSSLAGEEELAEASIKYIPIKKLVLSTGYGANRIGEKTSKRFQSGINFKGNIFNGDINYSRTKTDISWDRLWGGSSANLWILSPKISSRFEDKRGNNGFRFWESSIGSGVQPSEWLRITPALEYRDDKLYIDGTLKPKAITKAYIGSLKIFSWDFLLRHSEYKAIIEGERDVVADIASITGPINIDKPELRGRLKYGLSRERSEILEPYYLYVGEGRGNYRFDNIRGEYIAEVGGEYLRDYRATGEFTPVVRSELRSSANLSLKKFYGESFWRKTISMFSFEGIVQSDGRTKRTDRRALILDPRTMFEDDSLLIGQFNSEGAIKIDLEPSRGVTLRRRFDKMRNAQWTTGEELRLSDKKSIELRNSFGAFGNWRGGITRSDDLRLFPASTRRGVDLDGTEFTLGWNKPIVPELQLSADLSFLNQTDEWGDDKTAIKRYAIMPGFTYIIRIGTIRGSVQYSRVEADSAVPGILPYEMAYGEFIGDNGKIELFVNLNIASGTILSLQYKLETHSDVSPEHTALISIRLTF